MIKTIYFYYYAKNEKVEGKSNLSEKKECKLDFDDLVYRDDEDNYKNLASDYLAEAGVENYYMLTISGVYSHKRGDERT